MEMDEETRREERRIRQKAKRQAKTAERVNAEAVEAERRMKNPCVYDTRGSEAVGIMRSSFKEGLLYHRAELKNLTPETKKCQWMHMYHSREARLCEGSLYALDRYESKASYESWTYRKLKTKVERSSSKREVRYWTSNRLSWDSVSLD